MLASHLENEMRDTNNINSLFYVCSKGINSCLFAFACTSVLNSCQKSYHKTQDVCP